MITTTDTSIENDNSAGRVEKRRINVYGAKGETKRMNESQNILRSGCFCCLFGPLTRIRDPDYIGANLDSKASEASGR